MFKSCYGYIAHNDPKTLQHSNYTLVHKAVDFGNSIEVFGIGSIFGEDAPFQASIAVIRWEENSAVFLIHDHITLQDIEIPSFNRSKWDKNRRGTIPVTELIIGNLGQNLSHIKTGPRGMCHYLDCFPAAHRHGYKFESEEEKSRILSYITAALPVLYFDRYSILCPSPSICISVTQKENKPQKSLNEITIKEKSKVLVESLVGQEKYVKDIMEKLLYCAREGNIPLEIVTSELLDLERLIFCFGFGGYYHSLWKTKELLSVLSSSFELHYKDLPISYEIFLLEVITTIKERVASRVLYEQNCYKKETTCI